MKKAIEEVERNVGKIEEKKRSWWDGECNEKKKEVRRDIRRWRKMGGKGEEYKVKRKNIESYAKGRRKRKIKSGRNVQRKLKERAMYGV